MQATCPQCSQVIAVDDTKVPSGPFMLRCPRCQKTMKVMGNGVEKAARNELTHQAPPPPASPSPEETAQDSPPKVEESASVPQSQEASQQPDPTFDASPSEAPPPTQQASAPPPAPAPQQQPPNGNAPVANKESNGKRVLVELADSEQTSVMVRSLQQQGYGVDTMDRWDERAIELQQGSYNLVVTHRNGLPSTPKNGLFHLVSALPPELRSRLFLVLVEDKYTTGNTNEAFAAMADFVCHPTDLQTAVGLLSTTAAEKGRLYRTFLDVLRRKEGGDL